MLDKDDPLLKITIPDADKERRAETLRAAQAAFDSEFSKKTADSEKNLAGSEKKSQMPQGFFRGRRLFGTGSPKTEFHMRKVNLLLGSTAIAASLALFIVLPALDGKPAGTEMKASLQDSIESGETVSLSASTSSDQEKSFLSSRAIPKPAAPILATPAMEAEWGAGGREVSKLQDDYIRHQPVEINSERYANREDQQMQEVAAAPVSTFSADTDTASYSTVRRMLENGRMPPVDAVRTEEMINYFSYDYAMPEDRAHPFMPTVAVYPTPWNEGKTELVHIGVKAFDLPMSERPPANLVFLIDVSGSMRAHNKLPMVKASLQMLVEQLGPEDTVAIVTYAGTSSVALEPTKVENKAAILSALQGLGAGGGTAGAEGLRTAYELAKKNFHEEGINRILLASDGDFNVGVSDAGDVASYVASQRDSGIFLSVLGYGMGNYQDRMMQAIAQNGNGVAAYIDTMSEARRVLSDQLSGTLFTVAKDVKFQVEFNPAEVKSYRLLGYETRALAQEDFDNDRVDAGEVGAGHEVTAIYEVVPAHASAEASQGLHFQPGPSTTPEGIVATGGEPAADIAFLRIRYKLPDADSSKLIERTIGPEDEVSSIDQASDDVRFAAAVAWFSRILRESQGVENTTFEDVAALAQSAVGEDKNGVRREFVDLVRTAQAVSGRFAPVVPKSEGGVAFPVD